MRTKCGDVGNTRNVCAPHIPPVFFPGTIQHWDVEEYRAARNFIPLLPLLVMCHVCHASKVSDAPLQGICGKRRVTKAPVWACGLGLGHTPWRGYCVIARRSVGEEDCLDTEQSKMGPGTITIGCWHRWPRPGRTFGLVGVHLRVLSEGVSTFLPLGGWGYLQGIRSQIRPLSAGDANGKNI